MNFQLLKHLVNWFGIIVVLLISVSVMARDVTVNVNVLGRNERYHVDSATTISQLKDKIAAKYPNLQRCNLRILIHEQGQPASSDDQLEDDEQVVSSKDKVLIVRDISFPGGGCQSYHSEPKL